MRWVHLGVSGLLLGLAVVVTSCGGETPVPEAGTADTSKERAGPATAAHSRAQDVLGTIAPVARDVIADNWNSSTQDREVELQDRLPQYQFRLVHDRAQMRETGPIYVDAEASTRTSMLLGHRAGGPLVVQRIRWHDDRARTPFRLARAPLVLVTPTATAVYYRLNRAFSPGGMPVDVRLNAASAPDAPPQDRGYTDQRRGHCYATLFEATTVAVPGALAKVQLAIRDRPKTRLRARVVATFDSRVDPPLPRDTHFARLGCR